jgi:SulP family sulfate permease
MSGRPAPMGLRGLASWRIGYGREQLAGDLTAGLIVTVLLIPQSLAYAMLAGLPAQMGLYASILPIIAYALFGTSMTLAVGPVAVASLMTASALQPLAAPGSDAYVILAIQLSLLSGLMLLLFGLLRLGFVAHLLSHPVISGFITGSAILIAVGQLKHLFGVRPQASESVFSSLLELSQVIDRTNGVTLAIGAGTLLFLWAARRHLAGALRRLGLSSRSADLLAKLSPMLAVIVTTALVALFALDERHGVAVVGAVPAGLPEFPMLSTLLPDWPTLQSLMLPALLISLVGFVESVSVAQSLALKRRERITPDRELLGLGAANIASAVSGGFPVTGGFARSIVNFSAGARTPAAGVISAVLMLVVLLALTGLFAKLPQAVLAATIIIAVTSLIDLETLRAAWRYDRADALALIATALGVLVAGVEAGILVGVLLSLAVLVWRSSHPHIAVVGRMPGTEHFRNVLRHEVQTEPGTLLLRIDENLFFANAAEVEGRVEALLAEHPRARRLVISFAGVNQIDSTALGMLTDLEFSLAGRQITLELAEVKGPVMDRLARAPLAQRLAGRVHLSLHEALVRGSLHAPGSSV